MKKRKYGIRFICSRLPYIDETELDMPMGFASGTPATAGEEVTA